MNKIFLSSCYLFILVSRQMRWTEKWRGVSFRKTLRSFTPAEVDLLHIHIVQLRELKQAHFIIMALCHSGLKALVMNNYSEGREHGRIQNKDMAWRGQPLKSRCVPWIIHVEKCHTLQMNACQNSSCFPTSAVALSVLQQVNQSINHTEDSIWLMVNILEDKITSVDDFRWSEYEREYFIQQCNVPFSQNFFWIFKKIESVYSFMNIKSTYTFSIYIA